MGPVNFPPCLRKCDFIVMYSFKGRVHCFSMQFVMNKCFLLNPEKKLAQIHLVVFDKNAKNAHFNSEK